MTALLPVGPIRLAVEDEGGRSSAPDRPPLPKFQARLGAAGAARIRPQVHRDHSPPIPTESRQADQRLRWQPIGPNPHGGILLREGYWIPGRHLHGGLGRSEGRLAWEGGSGKQGVVLTAPRQR